MLGLFLSSVSAERFAVLIAGSNTFGNYRHQADISNMYTQLVNRGFDADHIVHMAYDDIAYSSSNPFQGQIFHTLDHINIYPGSSTIDYSSSQFTAQNFYNVLTTSLPSTSNDYVYIYYDNHGGPGILGVPDGVPGGYIEADDLASALSTMQSNGKYKYCFFGIEACYSGSVASQFTASNLACITAANDHESSYASTYDPQIGAYLSNEFSNYWMAFMDSNPTSTIGDMYNSVKASTSGSHVCYFGDESMKSMAISDFLGTPNVVAAKPKIQSNDIVPAYLATKSHLKVLAKSSKRCAAKAKLALHNLNAASEKLSMTLTEIHRLLEPATANQAIYATCGKVSKEYFEVLRYFTAKYGVVNGDDFPMFSVLVNLALKYKVADIKSAIDAVL